MWFKTKSQITEQCWTSDLFGISMFCTLIWLPNSEFSLSLLRSVLPHWGMGCEVRTAETMDHLQRFSADAAEGQPPPATCHLPPARPRTLTPGPRIPHLFPAALRPVTFLLDLCLPCMFTPLISFPQPVLC